ncbi:cytochrome P450 [Burkholderia cepacia]|uniref:cytochrome P450 n=1 Tax=Burkholderia cepacia TaxID=292 RepID=UPI001CF3A921|nr:cytochrome P450 [Burkholderia cepacia]MCA8111792.1 cytochrome P450 [Burkholderia cepacia]MCA8398962.1 cytochrome P450 [Burkholderia cepacia]
MRSDDNMSITDQNQQLALRSTASPYSNYANWRKQAKVLWRDEYFDGAWVVTGYDDVKNALKDPRLSAQRTGGWVMGAADREGVPRTELMELQRLFGRALLFLDNPEHGRVRKAMQAGFHPALIEALRPGVTRIVGELIDDINAVPEGEPFEFIERFARRLPSRVIALLLGLDHVPPDKFLSWTTNLALFLGVTRPSIGTVLRAREGIVEMSAFFEAQISLRRQFPCDDMISRLVRAEESGQIQGQAELIAQCAMLLFAGYETTRHSLGTAVYWLLSNPSLWRRLQASSSLLPRAIRELLRFDSPVQYTGRRAKTDFILGDQQIRRGELIVPLIGSANRDPEKYAEPDEIRIERDVGMPLSFGTGPHVCIGAGLTLLELEIALSAILHRWPALSLAGETPRWIDQPLYRGLESLTLIRSRHAAQTLNGVEAAPLTRTH